MKKIIMLRYNIIYLLVCCLLTTINAVSHDQFEEKLKLLPLKIQVSNIRIANMSKTSTLLISCIDFRLVDETERLMSQVFGLIDDYDQITLPGASLALVADQYPHWGKTINDIVDIALQLHNIKRIILLDHRDCGAYKLIQGSNGHHDHISETKQHKEVMLKAKKVLQDKFPKLKIYTLLLGLDGKVENLE